MARKPLMINVVQIETAELGFDGWVADCPLWLISPNAPRKRDVLGTLLLSVLAGHRRYESVRISGGPGTDRRCGKLALPMISRGDLPCA